MNAIYPQPNLAPVSSSQTQNPFGTINQNNPLFNSFGGYQNFMNGLNSFAQQIRQDPRQQAQQMLNSGQMSQQQFEWCRQMANQIMGMNY